MTCWASVGTAGVSGVLCDRNINVRTHGKVWRSGRTSRDVGILEGKTGGNLIKSRNRSGRQEGDGNWRTSSGRPKRRWLDSVRDEIR